MWSFKDSSSIFHFLHLIYRATSKWKGNSGERSDSMFSQMCWDNISGSMYPFPQLLHAWQLQPFWEDTLNCRNCFAQRRWNPKVCPGLPTANDWLLQVCESPDLLPQGGTMLQSDLYSKTPRGICWREDFTWNCIHVSLSYILLPHQFL